MSDRTFLTWPFFEDAHRTLHGELDAWIKKIAISINNQDEDKHCRELVQALGKSGFLKYCVPSSHGGKYPNLDVRSICLCRESLAHFSGLADFAFAMQGLGSGPISLFGNKEQKARYLPLVSGGAAIAAFALSESEAGSDVASISTSATRDGNFYVLNGEKAWISNAGLADFYVVFARSESDPGARGLSAFIVDATQSGLSIPERTHITSPHPVGTVRFENCRVPSENILGSPGQGFKIAMATLDVFRSTVAAAALGFARRALDEAIQFASGRKLFGSMLVDYQLTKDKIASIATEIDASALLIYRAAWTKDHGAERVTREAAMAKWYVTEAAQRAIDQALQIFGGRGVVVDSIMERLYRDIRPLRIYEGTSEIQKLIIADQTIKALE